MGHFTDRNLTIAYNVWGGGLPSPADYGVWGERRSGVRGGAPRPPTILWILSVQNDAGGT